MTIDEHFLYMVILEAFIFFIGIGGMYYQQRRTANMIEEIKEDPDILVEAVFGIMDAISNDEEKQQIFFGFVQTVGINAFEGVRSYLAKDPKGGVAPDLKGVPPSLKGIIKFTNALGIDLGGIVNQKIKQQATQAAQAVEW